MVEGRQIEPQEFQTPWSKARAVFVTLRDANGQLRGCVGRLEPGEATLGAEVARTARSAAREDPRFSPVSSDELPGLSFEVSVLEPAEPVTERTELDPKEYGVVVTSGARRGVLLPDIDGVDSAEQQVCIACDKGCIDFAEPHQLSRFRVRKVYGRPS
jgi:AmmeMemoRadiSam system protein A